MNRARLGAVLSVCWVWTALWLWPLAVSAGTLSADVNVYDWTSLGYAGALGLLGGVLALIVALATDRRVVREVLGEGVRNAIVSPIAGGVAYLLLESAAAAGWYTAPAMVRFACLVGAGWAGSAFFVWLRAGVARLAAALADRLVAKGKP